MPADELDFLDRERLLGGASAKRAGALLFLIESRTARLTIQARRRTESFLTEDAAEERALAFVEAFSLARDVAVQPTVQDLERHAEQWAALVPRNARLQAALAHRLGEKYRFTARAAPGIRKALGLDEADVRKAYAQLYGSPLDSLYADRIGPRERVRWAWTRLAKGLESLPPFWTAYSLTLTEVLGASILALPIAVASIGPLAGVAVLVVLGVINVLTVAFIAEAVVRCGPMRFGNAFFGRLVADLLGRVGSLALSSLLFLFCLLALPVFYVGFGTALEDATSVPAEACVALLFLAGVFYLRRESLDATVATALAVGAVNLALIVGLSLIAFAQARGENLLHTELPFTGGRAFEGSVVAVVFGVVLFAYFGHTAVAICGGLVLRRDPSGASLIKGCAAAQATVIVVYCLFVLAANGAVDPDVLSGEVGTVLSPLADEAGFGVNVLGSLFVVLALGMGSIYFVLALFGLTRERLPSVAPRVVVLPRRRARLVFEARRDGLRLGVTYLGAGAGGARFAVDREHGGRVEHGELVATAQWNVLRGEEAPAQTLRIEILESDDRQVRVAVTSTLRMAYEGEWDGRGLGLADLLELSDVEAELVGWLARSGEASVGELVAKLGSDEPEAMRLMAALVERGAVEERRTAGGRLFSARLAPRRARPSRELWAALEDGEERRAIAAPGTLPSPAAFGWRALALGRRGRFGLSMVPVLVTFVAAEWMVLTGSGSFTSLLSFTGVIVVSLLGGLYPVLLLAASRRKGDRLPGTVHGFLGHPALLVAVYGLFVAGLFLHGLLIWDGPVERAGALAAGVAMLVLPPLLLRAGAFSRRLTVEVRDDQGGGPARFAMVSGGRPAGGDVLLRYEDDEWRGKVTAGNIPEFDSLRQVVFEPRGDKGPHPRELKVWAHRVTVDEESEPLLARVAVREGGDVSEADVSLSRGEALFPVKGHCLEIEIALAQADER